MTTPMMAPPAMDKKTKLENVDRMYNEGVDMAMKMIDYLKEKLSKNPDFDELPRAQQKKELKEEKPEFVPFMQLHPIVTEYLIHEKLFSRRAFKRYLRSAYGHDKSAEDQAFLAKDPKNVYFYKNKQYALYYKYLVQESNSHLGLAQINIMYNHMVESLNKDTKEMLDRYEAATKQVDAQEKELTEQKKKEFIQFLKSQVNRQ